MKKLLICLLSIFLLTGCNTNTKLTAGQKFKEEYESLNGQKDDVGNEYVSVEIDENCSIVYPEESDVDDAFLRGTHVVYLGWPSCGWCRRAIPVLIDTLKEYSGINLYVFDIKEARTAYEKQPDSEKGKLYKQVTEAIVLSELDLDNLFDKYDDGTIKLPSSMIYFIKEGTIVGVHKRTVSSHIDAYEPLTSIQIAELSGIYKSYLDQMVKDTTVGCGDCD